MELLRFTGVARHYGANEVFTDLSGVVRDGDKIALVGPNGAGKSSLVRILVGGDPPDAGTLMRARDSRFGYLAQDAAEGGPQTLGAAFAEALERGQAHEWEMRATLNRFGFGEADLDRPLTQFSGGQRTRALLARTLLESPDWLLLDEPTNHLDLDTVRWLENFVAGDNRAYLIVSHDRFFLETVATQVWELDRGVLTVYDVKAGRAYTDFLEQREALREQQRRDYEAALTERKRQRAVIDELKTHGSHNYSHVRSREKAFARVDAVEAPRSDRRAIGVALTAARRATNGVAIEIKGLAKAYGAPLFSGVDAFFARGDRVAIVGPNGAGKTTFLRIISGEMPPDHGTIRYGTGLKMAAYSQSSVDDLAAGDTAAEAVMRAGVTDEEARTLLGRLNLGGDSGDKPVEAFSGGERRRIMLARLMAQKADCLFLDEPTNDLDIPSREALEDVLASYDGALFVVSHDRYLLKRLGQRVVAIRNGTATIIDGDYETYERIEHESRKRAAATAKAGKKAESRAGTSNAGKAKNIAEAATAKPGVAMHAGGHDSRGAMHAGSHQPAGTGHGPASPSRGSAHGPRDANGHAPLGGSTAAPPDRNGPKLDRQAAHDQKLDLGRRKRAVTDAERRVAALEDERADIERQFAAADVYDDPTSVVTLQRELDRVRAESEQAMAAWERAVEALEA